MADRKATFAKRQRETDLKDRAKAKDERRAQKRGEVREGKGPQIAWGEAVHAVVSDDDAAPPPAPGTPPAGQAASNDTHAPATADTSAAPSGPPAANAPNAPGPAPRRVS